MLKKEEGAARRCALFSGLMWLSNPEPRPPASDSLGGGPKNQLLGPTPVLLNQNFWDGLQDGYFKLAPLTFKGGFRLIACVIQEVVGEEFKMTEI